MYSTDYHIVKMKELTEPNPLWPIVPCKYGYTYDKYPITSSIVIDVSIQSFLLLLTQSMCKTYDVR